MKIITVVRWGVSIPKRLTFYLLSGGDDSSSLLSLSRGSDFSTSFEDLWVDISKQLVDSTIIELLSDLAEESKINQFFLDMMAGSPVNSTEKKPALHTALRAPKDSKILVEGANVIPRITETLEKMEELHWVSSSSVPYGKIEMTISKITMDGKKTLKELDELLKSTTELGKLDVFDGFSNDD